VVCELIITPEVIFRKKKEAFIVELVRLHQNTELGRRLPVYDGGKNLYTAGSLPFTHKEFNIVLNEDDEGASSTR
jgi:eukaryotic translation initiation factor 2C